VQVVQVGSSVGGASASWSREGGSCFLAYGNGSAARTICLGRVSAKNYKFKPVQPKLKETSPEELFGESKELNIPAGAYFLLVRLIWSNCR